jgi:hypothetical protein
MDPFLIIFLIAIVIAVVGGIIWVVFWIFIAKAVVTGIAKSLEEFQAMDVDRMYNTLLHLQQTGQIRIGQQYINSLDGPVTSEIRGMAASEGISLDF